MASDDVTITMAGLIEISNQVNETICRPLAERAKAAMEADAASFSHTGHYAESFKVVSDPRTGIEDWAHTYVENTAAYALVVESRHGTMARGLGSL